jgi:hypothetical protein
MAKEAVARCIRAWLPGVGRWSATRADATDAGPGGNTHCEISERSFRKSRWEYGMGLPSSH